jgi:HlyD family secretion protein
MKRKAMTQPSLKTRLVSGSASALIAVALAAAVGCAADPPSDRVRVSGHVEATEVRVASQVSGRVAELRVAEGDRVEEGAFVARLDTHDAELSLARARADLAQAEAQLQLLQAGARPEDVRVAEAQVANAQADVSVAAAERTAAEVDVERFERLLASSSGTRKQRDDAVARLNVAREREQAARERVKSAGENVSRAKAGARREEIDAARARIDSATLLIATWDKAIIDAAVTAPVSGIVTETLAHAGELMQARMPLLVITDLDRAWANVFVDEPIVPRLRIGQTVTLFTDAGGSGIDGTISYIASTAEFTPRNVQTADDRAKLVYRVKVSVDNTEGVLKVGMPVEAEIPFVTD